MIGGLDVTAKRNFFGSQLGSFVQALNTSDGDEVRVCVGAFFFLQAHM